MPAYTPALPHAPGTTYLVGGAVRDYLLDLPVVERDWVVVGATPQGMVDAGFKPVGKDFPVFLHPVSSEEYALARTERKDGHGYAGFSVYAAADVTLEQDLQRRDLTINAIAQDAQGQLIDPYGGQADLAARKLRHVSAHFVEDPLRVLRVARFKARFHGLGFELHCETAQLLTDIAASGELAHLTAERVWTETQRALLSDYPAEYFRLLRDTQALVALFPEIDALFGVPQTATYHPEIDTGVHVMLALEQAALLSSELDVRFCVLCHDFGKATTPKHILPSHRGHEQRGVAIIAAFCDRLKNSRTLKEMAQAVSAHHLLCHQARELRPETVLKLLESLDAFRRPERLETFLLACEADARGRTGKERDPYPQPDYLRAAFAAAQQVSTAELIAQGHQGAAIGTALTQARTGLLARFKRDYQNTTSSTPPSNTR